MRLALMSDIHGNPIALEAVLHDLTELGGADELWVLGDLCAIGYDPASVIKRLRSLPRAKFVRGNTDRYVLTGETPFSLDLVRRDPSLAERFMQGVASFAWTRGVLTATSDLGWLASLPLEIRGSLPDGTKLLGVHSSPGTDDGDGLHDGLSDEQLAVLVENAGTDLVFVGHTHRPLDREVGNIRVVNLGSVSNPLTEDIRASYVFLDANESGYTLEARRVEYDVMEVVRGIRASAFPNPDYLLGFLSGNSLWGKRPGSDRGLAN